MLLKTYNFSINCLFLIFIVVLGLGCDKTNSIKEDTAPLQIEKSLSSADNGQSYDGKISYFSRENVVCDGQAMPKSEIVGNTILNSFKLATIKQSENGSCRTLIQEQVSVEEFRNSQLAAYEGKLYEKFVNGKSNSNANRVGEQIGLVLNNANTRIVCKLNLGPLVLLDNEMTGAVVIQTAESSVWKSRLDFAYRSDKTNRLFDAPPIGSLIQMTNSLEFRSDSKLQNPENEDGSKQLMHIVVERPYIDTLSPSQNFGRKVYPGTFQYFYLNNSLQSPFSISTAALPSTCFVDQIDVDITQVDSSIPHYNFMDQILQLFQ